MPIISLIQALWVCFIIVFFFAKIRIGLCLYTAYIILVPYMNINIGIPLQWNFVNMLLLIALIWDFSKHKEQYRFNVKPFVPFFFMYGLLFSEIPFQGDVPLDVSINAFRLELMLYLILPLAIWNVSQYDNKLSDYLRNTILGCIVIAVIYGLYLTTTNGMNPYQILIQAANGEEWNETYAEVKGGRLFGRISSVFSHPMTFGMFLGLALFYLMSLKEILKKYAYLLMALIIVAIFLCGIRSPIGALFVSLAVYLILSHKVKLFFQMSCLFVIGFAIIQSIPDLANYTTSIFDKNSTEVSGSSLDMRMEQLMGCLKEIDSNPLFGKGFGWVGWYKSIHGDHPVILSFESLAFVVLCNSGFIGILIWIITFLKIFRIPTKLGIPKEMKICIILLCVYYLSYSMITGEYGYMKFLILFYTCMLSYSYKKYKNESTLV